MNHLVTELFLESEKKNSFRYDADPGVKDPAIMSVYVMKAGLKGQTPPKRIRVTITEAE
jgi:hypothetical protein